MRKIGSVLSWRVDSLSPPGSFRAFEQSTNRKAPSDHRRNSQSRFSPPCPALIFGVGPPRTTENQIANTFRENSGTERLNRVHSGRFGLREPFERIFQLTSSL